MALRSSQQNRSLHLLFTQIAEALDREGHTVQDITKAIKRAEIRVTPEIVKEVIWRPLQDVMYGKKSTTELEKHEVDRVYEVLNFWLGQNFNGLCVPFPSDEQKTEENLGGYKTRAGQGTEGVDYPQYKEPLI